MSFQIATIPYGRLSGPRQNEGLPAEDRAAPNRLHSGPRIPSRVLYLANGTHLSWLRSTSKIEHAGIAVPDFVMTRPTVLSLTAELSTRSRAQSV